MKKYGVIYADPPWAFSNRPFKRSESGERIYDRIDDKYDVMTPEDISALPVKNMAADDSVMFMWTTDAHLEFALGVMKAWGFKYKTIAFIWSKKTSTGKQAQILGPYGMKNCEICLLGTRGKGHSLIEARNVQQLIESSRGGHSEKPQEARDRIQAMFGAQEKVELFARKRSEGWDVFGNQVDGSISMDQYGQANEGAAQ